MSKAKILIVDDHPALSALYKIYLERTGRYEVLEVNCSLEAAEAARVFRPDAVLLDVYMPGMDGRALARDMARDPLLCHIPIMFITTHMFQKEARDHEVMNAGRRFLAKSHNSDALVAAVERLVRRGHLEKPSGCRTGRV